MQLVSPIASHYSSCPVTSLLPFSSCLRREKSEQSMENAERVRHAPLGDHSQSQIGEG